jgi:hypothetical protein
MRTRSRPCVPVTIHRASEGTGGGLESPRSTVKYRSPFLARSSSKNPRDSCELLTPVRRTQPAARRHDVHRRVRALRAQFPCRPLLPAPTCSLCTSSGSRVSEPAQRIPRGPGHPPHIGRVLDVDQPPGRARSGPCCAPSGSRPISAASGSCRCGPDCMLTQQVAVPLWRWTRLPGCCKTWAGSHRFRLPDPSVVVPGRTSSFRGGNCRASAIRSGLHLRTPRQGTAVPGRTSWRCRRPGQELRRLHAGAGTCGSGRHVRRGWRLREPGRAW